jgi:urate oxidase
MPLLENSYGKSKVRITKVVRTDSHHTLFECDVAIELQGDFAASYTVGDNTRCIATDSMKNTVYVLAKEHAFVDIEGFSSLLAQHFVATYPQVTRATVEVLQTNWQRISINGKPHEHAFMDGGSDRRVARCFAERGRPADRWGGIRSLRVLKTTNSQWHTFVTDRYRTLPDAHDRVFATQIDADWHYDPSTDRFDAHVAAIRSAILTTFANHQSLSVQQTLLAMGEAALASCDAIDRIEFTLPNLHRIPMNLAPFGLEFANDIYVATDEPHGLIKGTVVRGRQP